ncbi:hypothetical protein IID23_03245 [Patescibacteria group bacterium]|nr:hypothetical protein [Patescibacteria group bacterium]
MKILIYAADQAGYSIDSPFEIVGHEVDIAGFNSFKQFQDYDGVFTFPGVWANDHAKLSTKIKEWNLLNKKGGFICVLVDTILGDSVDLATKLLKEYEIDFYGVNDGHDLRSSYKELDAYLGIYGVAKYSFEGETLEKVNFLPLISDDQRTCVGFCLNSKIFFLPVHPKGKDLIQARVLFESIIPAVSSLYSNFNENVPGWVNEFTFENEKNLLGRRKDLEKDLGDIRENLKPFMEYKKLLTLSGEPLRKVVAFVLERGFGYIIDETDNYREDLKILEKPKSDSATEETKTLALVEVKGVGSNVSRSAINQLDDHKEDNGLDSSFPGILIINTFIKKSSLEDKDVAVDAQQIAHASKHNVIILRTLDLLRALEIIARDSNKKKEFTNYLLKENGWLEVKNKFILHKE